MKQEYLQLSFIPEPIEAFLMDRFSADGLCSDTERRIIENKYAKVLEVTGKFNRQSVSYQLSKKDVLHSWLKYKEGFSADLVNSLLGEMGVRQGDWVMDPFVGSGTTALVCGMRGINSIGYDIMPISGVSIKAKEAVYRYNLDEILALAKDVEALSVPDTYKRCTSYIGITQDAYPEANGRFFQYITDWKDASAYTEDAKNLLTLCIINSLERCSYTSKSGQYLSWDCRSPKVLNTKKQRLEKGKSPLPEKYVRKTILDAKKTILEELCHVIYDIESIQNYSDGKITGEIKFKADSVLYRLPKLQNDFLAGVITSPPYCNRYDYTRTYALELVYLGLGEQEIKDMRQNLLSCTVENHSKLDALRVFYESINQQDRFAYIYSTIQKNAAYHEIMSALKKRKEHGDLNNHGVIRMVEGYFIELGFVFAELYRVCKSGAMVAFVNDNVRYGGEVIPVDFLSSSIAEQFGFKVKKIYTLRQQKGNSSQQMAKFGRVALRKSITLWIKE